MDHSGLSKGGVNEVGPGCHADSSAVDNGTQNNYGNTSISHAVAGAVPPDNEIAEIKVERPDDDSSSVVPADQPSLVNLHRSSHSDFSAHQQGQLIESGIQTEMKQEWSANPHMNMYDCSQRSQDEVNDVLLQRCKAEEIQSHTVPQCQQSVPSSNPETTLRHVLPGNIKQEVVSLQGHVGTAEATPQQPQLSTNAAGVRRKRLHMHALDCDELAQTEQGSMALKNPAAIRTSSNDVNRGLYPRPPRPPPPHHQGIVAASSLTSPTLCKRMRSPSKIKLSPKQIKSQSTMDQYFPISPGKPEKSIDKKTAQPGHQSVRASQVCSSPIPKYANMGSAKSPTGQMLDRSTASRNWGQAFSTASPEKDHLGSPSHRNGQPWTPGRRTEAFINQVKESPKSTSSRPSAANSFIQPSLPGSQESTPTKIHVYPKPNQSPAKSEISTVESDIEDFNNDTTFDDLDFVATTAQDSSKVNSLKTDGGIKAFDNDSFFDNMDPEMLSADSQSIPSLPSSQTGNNPPETFGLLGEDFGYSDEETTAPGFDQLPLEVLQRIFCFVPMTDLCRHLSCVCKLWNEIISKEEFMPWKKTYHRVRRTVEIDYNIGQLNLAAPGTSLWSEASFMLDLVRNMPKFQARFGTSMDRDLQKHPKYVLAKDIMKDKAPELLQSDIPNPWSTIALLIILSETVHDVSAILRYLLHPTATCTTIELLECLYCIASHLWSYKRIYGQNIGWHYRVYYTLYLFENSQSSVSLTPEGLNDGRAMGPHRRKKQRTLATHEQYRIISHDVERGQVVKIEAFAGTGKTTTLVKYAEKRPDMSFLYVAFNKSVKEHGKSIFPDNVKCSTTHSLAYAAIGYRYKRKIVKSLKPFSVKKVLPTREEPKNAEKLHWVRYAKMVCKTLGSYCASADELITTSHVPAAYFEFVQQLQGIVSVKHELSHSLRMKIGNDASSVWKKMTDTSNLDAKITHDVYLKLFQLSKPRNLDYDCLLIDEAQDLTPAQQDILMNQRGAKILVGDHHQQIYSFRGATNAMNRVVSQHTFHLTQSFRFGPGIAYIADCLLERSSKKVRQILVGKMTPDHIDGEEIGQVAIITRSNVTLFTEAVRIVSADTTTMIAFAGGIDGYGLDVILDIHQLLLPMKERGFIENMYIAFYKTFGDLKVYANQAEDSDLLNKIKIVEQYNIRIPELIQLIQSRTRNESSAGCILSTVHKSKGLEFDTVKITDDFAINNARRNTLAIIDRDELNMIYVAVTRAKKSLVLTRSLVKFLSEPPSSEKFLYPVPVTSSSEDEEPKVCNECNERMTEVCDECHERMPEHTVVLLKKKNFKLAYPTCRLRGGDKILCPQCSLESNPSLQCFFNV